MYSIFLEKMQWYIWWVECTICSHIGKVSSLKLEKNIFQLGILYMFYFKYTLSKKILYIWVIGVNTYSCTLKTHYLDSIWVSRAKMQDYVQKTPKLSNN